MSMVRNVYDLDERLWAAWMPGKGYMSEWMPEKKYRKWIYIHYGIVGQSLTGKSMIYRSEADEADANRKEMKDET